MFWGLRLEPGKRYSTTVDTSFHISMAALDCSTVKSDNEVLSVMLDEEKTNVSFILCNLQKSKLMQSPLDLNFMSGDRITIYCKGNGVVHLSGYLVLEDDELLEQLGEEEDDEEAEEETDEVSDNEETQASKGKMNGLERKRKVEELKKQASKRKKLEKLDEDSDDSEDDEDDDDDDGEDEEDENMDLEEEESDEENEEEDSDEESADENKMPSKPQTKKNKANLQNQQVGANKQQAKGKQPQKTENGLPQDAQVKKNKKKGDKVPAGGAQNTNAKLNKSNESPTHGTKALDGGVTIKEIKVGNGPVVKPGKMACVYYVGRFKQNNKVFDSTTDGAGFKFRVGKGEVIKGWDLGLNGMKVGGKRLITCPPNMAYGQKGSPPTIPPNSTLVFEVELKSIN